MTQISIEDALERLGSSKQRERRDGLQDLKHLLNAGKRRGLREVKDRGYHAIFEALFRLVQTERSSYLRYSKGPRNQAAAVLSESAAILRLAVEVGVRDIRQKALRALTDHIIETLPETEGGQFCEPLATHYLRALVTILQHQPHPGHLSEAQWLQLVDFCQTYLRVYIQTGEESDSFSLPVPSRSSRRNDRHSRASSPSSVGGVLTPLQKSFAGGEAQKLIVRNNHIINDLVTCLYYLLRVPHARVIEVAKSSLDVLNEFLDGTAPLSQPQGQEKAFACYNVLLNVAVTENIELAKLAFERCIHHTRRLWHAKLHDGLKDQMLANLALGAPLLEFIVRDDDDDAQQTRTELEHLLEILTTEYYKRNERDLLQQDDLERCDDWRLRPLHPFVLPALRVRPGHRRCEHSAVILLTISRLHHVLYYLDRPSGAHDAPEANSASHPRKRRKNMSPVELLFDDVSKSKGTEQIAWFQMLAFLPVSSSFASGAVKEFLELVSGYVAHESNAVSAWAMIAVAVLAYQTNASDEGSLDESWLQIWKLATQKLANPATSRFASHLVSTLIETNLINVKIIAEAVDVMLSSIELNGPVGFSDFSLTLWRRIIAFKARQSPSSASDVASRVSRWIFLRWQPSQSISGPTDSIPRPSTDTQSILQLFAAVLGTTLSTYQPDNIEELGVVAVASLKTLNVQKLLKFLLLQPDDDKASSSARPSDMHLNLPDTQLQRLLALITDALLAEIGTCTQSLREGRTVRNITTDSVSTISSLTLCSIWLTLVPRSRGVKLARLQRDAMSLGEELAKLMSMSGSPTKDIPLLGIYRSIGQLARFDAGSAHGNMEWSLTHAVQLAALPYNIQFWRAVQDTQNDAEAGADLMEMDEIEGSQPNLRSKVEDEERPADWLAYSSSAGSKTALYSLRVCLAASHGQIGQESQARMVVPPEFIDFILERSPSEFLCCREFFQELLESDLAIDPEQVEALLGYLGEEVLHCYEFERSEVAMGLCLDLLSHFVEDWTTSDDDVADLASQFYQWFTNIVVGKNIASPHVHTCLSRMLQKVIAIRPDYAKALSLPSARTTLLKILENGQVSVKFETGVEISDIFGFFVLKEHDAILDDVIEHLPLEIDWLEGTAVRIYILANLASSWPTLIRRCLFALVEAPFLVHSATSYASFCIQTLSARLHLRDANELFRLFAPQIIYSWLESRPLESLPYSIFKYSTLREMLEDVQDEITAQVLMRGREAEAEVLREVFSALWTALLEKSFGKASAYAIARDAAISPEVDREAAHGVSRLTKLLGKEKYRSLIASRFPEILATFFKLIDREDSVVKGFEKYELHALASNTYGEIRSSGMSDTGLASSQQPSFKASCLADEIDFICSRSPYGVENMWTPALYVFVFRELVKTFNDALGPLHSITVVQRIRILISMAGPTVLADYPLEMTLHALRPLLVKTYCAEDTMGIFQYLLSKGAAYLQTRPQFLTGLGVAILVSLRRFINTPQESTTQESQYRATMAKAEKFHLWIGKYLEEREALIDEGPKDDRIAIARAARQVRSGGSAVAGQAESDLLKALLHDEYSDGSFVEGAYRDLIMSMLCVDFRLPERPRDDIIHLDNEASNYGNVIWKTRTTCQHSDEYRLWVARVIGRAYAASGHVGPDLVQETRLDMSHRASAAASQYLTSESRLSILQRLQRVLLSDKRADVGIAESTIQGIVNQIDDDESLADCIEELPPTLLPALQWKPYPMPSSTKPHSIPTVQDAFFVRDDTLLEQWSKKVCMALIGAAGDSFLRQLHTVVARVEGLATELFSHVIHLALLKDFDKGDGVRKTLSSCIGQFFSSFEEYQVPFAQVIIKAILYLRSQTLPREASKAERAHWVEVDFYQAADVSIRCNMYKTALLFLEIRYSELAQTRSSRRSSATQSNFPNDLLTIIFQNLDDKDSFYGLKQPPNLKAMMGQLEFENSGFKSLSFRGAAYDSEIQQLGKAQIGTEGALLRVLDGLDLDGLSMSMFASTSNDHPTVEDIMFTTARKLENWDLASPMVVTSASNELFRVYQDIHDAASYDDIRASLNRGFANIFTLAHNAPQSAVSVHSTLSALATLSEVEDVLSAEDLGTLEQVWTRMEKRDTWMLAERFDRVQDILSCRKTLFSMLSKSPSLQHVVNVSPKAARTIEVKALLACSSLFRQHEALQTCLGNATTLDSLVYPCKALGLSIDVAAQYEVSNVMWDQAEMVPSIQILRDLLESSDLSEQTIHVAEPVLLARLGHRIAEARLEKSDEIISNYLAPAIKELHGRVEGPEAGQVYHEFASFCDQQLQNSDNTEDMERIQKLRDRKEDEVNDLEKMMKAAPPQSKERGHIKGLLSRAQQWLDLDNREYKRLKDGRQALLQRSLENYLLCLQACDSYDNDALRFSALWLEFSDNEAANIAVARNLQYVPTRKFASLMNQWSSRLLELDREDDFQALLFGLVLRICVEHPYHGMYHIFASSKSKGGPDQTAIARNRAAHSIVEKIKAHNIVGSTWIALHNTNVNFVRFAVERSESAYKQGARIQLRKSPMGQKLDQDAKIFKVPPPTMKIELRADCDYSQVPIIQRYQSEFQIASGVSSPKILAALGSDGKRYKQLFKGGNDDLRQDAIMEQVFEQVSNLLRSQRETRLRNLGIRTYRVLPLIHNAGVIEFVSNTMPLSDYLMPAHQRYYPNDYKNTACRRQIQEAQPKPNEHRVMVFRQVCEKFHPVLRHFFMERYENPDDWYGRRLAYTRSTAAISVLGHILGLGDRHGHNILLDETTGEVIHIDLGIAFEQGRVLPVPEVVPFRLTRDLVDGMGITKTEGVFRRCCEFTLDALRKEAYSIMTILDVLRYDPLYSWSLSPLRLKRLQEEQRAELGDTVAQGAQRQENKDEQGEADRALLVVSKKLSKTLSVTATVNELIQQATDERNLALLYAGWAAYA